MSVEIRGQKSEDGGRWEKLKSKIRSYQLSAVSDQLTVNSCRLSAAGYLLSVLSNSWDDDCKGVLPDLNLRFSAFKSAGSAGNH